LAKQRLDRFHIPGIGYSRGEIDPANAFLTYPDRR
jgi:hypothetical protein